MTTEDEKATEDGSRDWSDVDTSQRMPAATFRKRQKASWNFLRESAWPTS